MTKVADWRFNFVISKTRYSNGYAKFKIYIYKFKI